MTVAESIDVVRMYRCGEWVFVYLKKCFLFFYNIQLKIDLARQCLSSDARLHVNPIHILVRRVLIASRQLDLA